MRKTLITLALTAGAIGAAACSAQTNPPQQDGAHGHRGGGRMGMMMRADTDHDGIITRAEAMAEADARFAKLDTNGDGQVTPDEMQAMRQAMQARMAAAGRTPRAGRDGGERWGQRRDADGNGVITKADAEARAMKRFDRMDANHDGRIDKTEVANLREMGRERHRGMHDGDTPPPPPPPPPADDNGQ
jgi:hypothetical protein